MPRKLNRILVVDSSEVARTIIVRILNEEMPDTELITCGTVQEACAWLERSHFDLITTALMLPDKVLKVMTDLLYANYGSDLERRVSTLKNVRTLSIPTLVIHDDRDTDIPWKDGRAVADAWPGAEFLLTHGLGHRRILRDPAVVTAITEFIRK